MMEHSTKGSLRTKSTMAEVDLPSPVVMFTKATGLPGSEVETAPSSSPLNKACTMVPGRRIRDTERVLKQLQKENIPEILYKIKRPDSENFKDLMVLTM